MYIVCIYFMSFPGCILFVMFLLYKFNWIMFLLFLYSIIILNRANFPAESE